MQQQVDYASPRTPDVHRSQRMLGIVSLVAAVLSILACLGLLRDRAPNTRDEVGGILIFMLMLAFVLLIGAVLLCRGKIFLGLLLHRIYAVLQLDASIALAFAAMAELYDSPAGMLFYLGIIPGAIAAIYPIGLIILWWQSKVADVTRTVSPGD